jgi:hypothetical protein
MSHSLPPQGHPARDMFDVADLVAVSTGAYPVACDNFRLRRSARETFARCDAARRITFFKVNASNDQLELVSVGRRGGIRKEWTFGPITKQTRLA